MASALRAAPPDELAQACLTDRMAASQHTRAVIAFVVWFNAYAAASWRTQQLFNIISSCAAHNFSVYFSGSLPHLGACVSQHLGYFSVVAAKGFAERGVAESVFAVDIHTLPDQKLDNQSVSFGSSQVNGATPVIVADVEVVS